MFKHILKHSTYASVYALSDTEVAKTLYSNLKSELALEASNRQLQ